MNGLNFQASVSNSTQMDRFQHDAHRTPVVNQEQNAQIARDEASRRLVMTVKPDQVDGKQVDPKQRKDEKTPKKNNRKKESGGSRGKARGNSGCLLDIEV